VWLQDADLAEGSAAVAEVNPAAVAEAKAVAQSIALEAQVREKLVHTLDKNTASPCLPWGTHQDVLEAERVYGLDVAAGVSTAEERRLMTRLVVLDGGFEIHIEVDASR